MNRQTRQRFPWLFEARALPLGIAHRGASDYAFDNTLRAFELAALAGADFWELDVRTTRDDVAVVYHDPALTTSDGDSVTISNVDLTTLLQLAEATGHPIPTLDEVVDLAKRHDAGLYIDAKDARALEHGRDALTAHGISRAVIGCFDAEALARLAHGGCDWPLAVLVPSHADPFGLAERTGADIVHLCWEHAAARPQDLVTRELLDEAARRDLAVVLWHEERAEIVDDLIRLPVLGICSNRPEMLKPYSTREQRALQVVCHRGFNRLAPENTLLAAEATFGAGFDIVELDVRESRDGALIVIHDATVDRTTDGSGAVADMTLDELRRLDAGSVRDPFFAGLPIPTLDELLTLTAARGRGLYIEIKKAPVATVLALVEQHGLLASCFFWSFESRYLTDLRELSSRALIMCRRKDHDSLDETIAFAEADIVEFDAMVDDLAEIDTCRRAGCRAMVAYNGSEEARFREILAHGPELLNLDDPPAFLRSL